MLNNETNQCRYYVATEEGRVVSWFPFISGKVELIVPTPRQAEIVLNVCRILGKGYEQVLPEDCVKEAYWHIRDGVLHTARHWMAYTDATHSIGDSWTLNDYIEAHTVGKLIDVTQEKWDSIGSDYKGTWQDYYDECPEWIGRKTVMSGCITEDPTELGKLLVEGVHFRIIGKGAENMKKIQTQPELLFNIPAVIKHLRENSKYSANDVVYKLKDYNIDISAKTLFGYESGLSMPNANVFVALCEIYQCDNPMIFFRNSLHENPEQEMIKKYLRLDSHGKEIVDFLINKELDRLND